ncbi:MAG: hypothetical protein E7065_05600 [Lentimicrobiaceae bacterium]|nr:hypothetical protein [Lentimicrobiaceae bacterium]
METLNYNIKTWLSTSENKELQNQIMKEEKEYIEKKEILDAIRDGLLEIKEARSSGRKLMTAEELLNEL